MTLAVRVDFVEGHLKHRYLVVLAHFLPRGVEVVLLNNTLFILFWNLKEPTLFVLLLQLIDIVIVILIK